ncbi:hypothetical protein [Streptomyces arenae]|uniref:hypothetical protein n=1 Tax=Streptomyces arenae TaxID=29301 RepID=UPI00265B394D|nr:hypothetical protein [Streptomyces arenae]MCG7210207.1 hypothetical protein [Streptomyces arenae]
MIAAQLRETGLVTLDGLASRQTLLAFTSRLMTIAPHPRSAPDGLALVHNTGSQAHRAGFAGLGSDDLEPHTDGRRDAARRRTRGRTRLMTPRPRPAA